LTFGTTRVVGRQPYAPAAFTPGEIPGTHFQRLSRPQGTWFRREPRKKNPQVTPSGIDPGSSRIAGTVWIGVCKWREISEVILFLKIFKVTCYSFMLSSMFYVH